MRTSGIRALILGAVLLLATVALLPSPASATIYNFNEVYNVTGQTCSAGDCFFAWVPPSTLFLHAGDVVNLDVTFSTPTYTVGGATGSNALYAALLDTNYFNSAVGTPSTDSATSTETLPGYTGPAGINTSARTFPESDFYLAYASLAGPNSGFSVTGFNAVFDINNTDPNQIEFFAVETQLINTPTVPEPSTVGLTILALGFLFAMRKRLPQPLNRTV